MELNRFKQLLESTMGNVKPLIMEQPTGTTQTSTGDTQTSVTSTTTRPTPKYQTPTYDKIIRASFSSSMPKYNYILMDDDRPYKPSRVINCDTGKMVKDPRGGKIPVVYNSNQELPKGCVFDIYDLKVTCDNTGCRPTTPTPIKPQL